MYIFLLPTHPYPHSTYFTFTHIPLPQANGGGVGVIVISGIAYSNKKAGCFSKLVCSNYLEDNTSKFGKISLM
jgi:hypothetical protein